MPNSLSSDRFSSFLRGAVLFGGKELIYDYSDQ